MGVRDLCYTRFYKHPLLFEHRGPQIWPKIKHQLKAPLQPVICGHMLMKYTSLYF